VVPHPVSSFKIFFGVHVTGTSGDDLFGLRFFLSSGKLIANCLGVDLHFLCDEEIRLPLPIGILCAANHMTVGFVISFISFSSLTETVGG
jgi:hypothetical protein